MKTTTNRYELRDKANNLMLSSPTLAGLFDPITASEFHALSSHEKEKLTVVDSRRDRTFSVNEAEAIVDATRSAKVQAAKREAIEQAKKASAERRADRAQKRGQKRAAKFRT